MRFKTLKTTIGSSLLLAACGDVKSNDMPDAGGADSFVPKAVPTNTATAGTVNEAAMMSLANNLVTMDSDTMPAQLVYTVQSLPADGVLKRDAVPLAVGGTFTQQEVNEGRVTYQHNGAENAADNFTWDLTDGTNKIPETGATPFAISVTPINDLPMIVNNEITQLAEGATEVLTTAKLSVTDPENAGALTYTYLSITRGALQKRASATDPFVTLTANQTFTQQNVNDGDVQFVDPGTDDANLAAKTNTTASFSWRVTDAQGGVHPSPTTSNTSVFTVTPVDDPASASYRATCNYTVNVVSPANPVQSLVDPDNLMSEYQICIVSVAAGDGTTINCVGTTTISCSTVAVTSIMPTIKQASTTLTVGSCVTATPTSLGQLTFQSSANVNGGSVTWKLMLASVQVGTNTTTSFSPTTGVTCN